MSDAVERELAEADAAVDRADWEAVQRHALAALEIDPSSDDASGLLRLARRRLDAGPRRSSVTAAERRTLTVMFCDLVGSTELADAADPEDTRRVLQWYHTLVATTIERHGGFVARYMGDGALAYFGWPAAVDDSALNAVRAGVALRDAVAAQRREVDERFGRPIDLRIGIHTGLVVVGAMGAGKRVEHDDVVGDTPNIAARLEGLAAPGTVLISNDTWRLVQHDVVAESLGPQQLKGISQPVEVHRVGSILDRPTRFSLAVHSGRFIGRDDEFGRLEQRWAEARAGRGSMVGIRGEAGVGKSRLLEQFVVRTGGTVTRIQCDPLYERTSFRPLLRTYGADALDDHGEHPELSVGLPARGPFDRARDRLVDAAVAAILADSSGGPAVVSVEDLHWADPSTIDVLERLGSVIASAPLLVLATYRPHWDDERLGLAECIDLQPLGRTSFDELLASLTVDRPLHRDVSDQIYLRTGGIPLFVEEVVNSLLEVGSFDALFEVPTSLHDVLVARLDRCGEARSTAQLASVIGLSASLELLRRVAGSDDLDDDLDVLERAGVISRSTPGRIVFRHALVRDAAYSTMLRTTVRDIHLRVAESMLARDPTAPETTPEVLAHHLHRGGRTADALPHWLRAAEYAIERSAAHETAAHLRSALSCIEPAAGDDHRELEIEIHLKLGAAYIATHGYGSAEVRTTYERAAELCASISESAAAFDALVGLTAYFLVSERLQQAEVTANRAVALGRRTRQPFALVTAASWLGTTKFFLGEFDDAQRLLLESLSGYDVDAHGRNARAGLDPAVLASSHLSWLRWLRGDVEAARRQEAETRVIADALDTPVARAHALNYAAGLAVLLGDADEALRIAEQEHEIASEFGLPHYVAYAEILAASARRDRDPAEAADALRAGLDKRGQTGARLAGTFHYALLADLELAAGRVTVAAAELATGRRVVADTAERWWLPEIERLEGEVHRSRGRAHDARECFERAHRTAIAMGAPMLATRALLSGAHLALDLHDVRRASKLVAAIEVPVAPTLPEARALEQIHAELSR